MIPTEVITRGVESDYDARFGLLEFLATVGMSPDVVGHMVANDLMNGPSYLAKEAPVFEEPLAKPHSLGEAEDDVAMRDVREPLKEMNRRRLGLPRYAAWANSSLTRERDRQTYIAGATLEQSDPQMRVAALLELEKRLLNFSAKGTVSAVIAALIERDKSQ